MLKIKLIISLFFLICCTSNNIAEDLKKIPLGGNSYVTASINGKVVDEGFENWTDAETVFSAFFRISKPGELKLFLQYSTEDENNEIEVCFGDQLFNLTLAKPVSKEDTVVFIGKTASSESGYLRLDFKGKSKTGAVYAKPSFLLVEGEAAEGMKFVDDFSYYWGRRGPSVHLNYLMPENETAEWFYNEIAVPIGEDPVGSYFMSNGFGEGYFGIQVNSETERRVLFSVWSPFETDNPDEIPDKDKIKLVKKGEGVYTGEFGNEGSGGQSYWRYNWKAGMTYKFLTRIRPVADGYSEYTSYFFIPESGEWKLIAQFLRPGTQTYYTRAHSFLENFSPEMGYKGRKAFYRNQ